MIEVRHSKKEDLERIDEIIDNAILFMRKNGNMEQWNDDDEIKGKIREDIKNKVSYVLMKDDRIVGTFAFILKEDETYKKIDGKWKYNEPYGVIHRTASSGDVPKIMDEILKFCFTKTKHIRIDTHRDNFPMDNALIRNGFAYCGVITLKNGQLRDAYERSTMELKKLGFGMMRLPRDEENRIDVETSKKMVDLFIERGFNYFDTAWVYEGSEDAVRQVLAERYPRDSYYLASKLAFWDKSVSCQDDCRKQFEESLKRTAAGYFDYYLIHCLEPRFYELADKYDVWSLVKEFKEEGKIRHYGFSFHGKPDELDHLLTVHPDIEFVQLQINYADWNNPRVESRKNYEVARKHGKPIIIMEPVKGGRLANPHDKVKEVLDSYTEKRSYASWAVSFAASLEGVMVVLSGMSTMDQVEDNTSFMKEFKDLNEEEKEIIEKARRVHESFPITGCTGCNYCAKVCPQEIPISKYFSNLDNAMIYGIEEDKKERFNKQFADSKKPDDCLECGACEGICPQHLPIRDYLKKVKDLF